MAKLFFSYSHKDEELRNELETHLALLKRQGIITSWHDRRITAGSDIHDEISSELLSSNIILLLISAKFLASDYCYNNEMATALKMHKEGKATVIPVILHPCDWESSSFGSLRATPTDGKPVTLFPNQQEAFTIITKDIRVVANKYSNQEEHTDQAKINENILKKEYPRSSNLRIKRKFDDHEKDEFLENSFEYIARFFEGSLHELTDRNSQIKIRFKRLSGTSFSAFIYENGDRITECSIYYGEGTFGSSQISYSNSGDIQRNSWNDSLSVIDDGYTMQLKPSGLQIYQNHSDKPLSQHGGAEYFWSLFIKPLQD